MRGRDERNLAIEEHIKTKLVKNSKLLLDYYYSMTDKTALTKHRYLEHVREYLFYLKENNITSTTYFKTVKKSDINMYMEHIRYRKTDEGLVEYSESIRAVKLAAIRNFYDYLVDVGYADINPCATIKPPKSNKEKEVVFMTEEEIAKIKDNIMKGTGRHNYKGQDDIAFRDLTIFTLGYRTGLRMSAIAEINVQDINFDDHIITVVEKGNFTRDIYIGDDTIKLLKEYLEHRKSILGGEDNCDALFVSNRKKRISIYTISNIFYSYTDGVNKHLTPHKMRSTHALHLYEATNDIYQVAESLGHKNIKNTRRYVRVSETRRRASANIMDKI